jgi:hypothetical protein
LFSEKLDENEVKVIKFTTEMKEKHMFSFYNVTKLPFLLLMPTH